MGSSMWIESSLSMEWEAARVAGPEMPHSSQGFVNGVLALTSFPLLGNTPEYKVVALGAACRHYLASCSCLRAVDKMTCEPGAL